MMVPALRDVFGYEGFRATYFVKADGTFSTTLFGYQPVDQLRETALEIAGEGAGATTAPPSSSVPSGGVGRHPPWEKRPLLALIPAPWAQWHPLLVHFPIALLVLEAVFVCALLVRPNERVAHLSTWLLGAAVLGLVPTLLTGIRDAGAALCPEPAPGASQNHSILAQPRRRTRVRLARLARDTEEPEVYGLLAALASAILFW